jgi:uridine kinase
MDDRPGQTNPTDDSVRPATSRTDVRATLPDGRIFTGPVSVSLERVMRAAYPNAQVPIVAALQNARLRELSSSLMQDADLVPIGIQEDDGARIFRRSLIFLMVTAAAEEFPNAELMVQHSVPGFGGYYCEVRARGPFSDEEIARLERRMREIGDSNAPIAKLRVDRSDAVAMFAERGEHDKALLFSHAASEIVPLYELRGRKDYFHGYMVPSTGCLRPFALRNHSPGFVLHFPHQSRPTCVDEAGPYPKLFQVFERANHLLEQLGIRNVGALNDAVAEGRLPEVSLVAEAMHEAAVAQIARDIASRVNRPIKLVLVAGPSASGKTTFSKRLAVQLLARGLKPFALALDDYFVDRELTPLDATGERDFESLSAIDVPLFNDHLRSLIAGRRAELPRYSFQMGRRERTVSMTLRDDNVIIVEGIHGLNPALVRELPADRVHRVYVSALTQLNLDRHSRISTSDSRLIRRIVRDAATRGYDATASLRRWISVGRGEKQHIFPFQEHSDAIFDSSLIHDLAVLRPYAEPLLLQVQRDLPEYREARRLLGLLRWFRPAPANNVPDNSILREFIGGSILENFSIWPDARTGRLDGQG